MADQTNEDRKPNIKTYVKGRLLLSEDGLEYKQQGEEGRQEEKVIEDKIGFLSLQKQIEKQRTEKQDRDKLSKRRNNSIVDKPTLIPIKDTPVDPVPEPILDNQKCQRATQEQFEYFQSYISQRERERKFEQAEERQLERFMQIKQQMANTEPMPVSIVFERDEKEEGRKKEVKRLVKIKVKRKEDTGKNDHKEAGKQIEKQQQEKEQQKESEDGEETIRKIMVVSEKNNS